MPFTWWVEMAADTDIARTKGMFASRAFTTIARSAAD